ncbi:hypothetical protein EI94DRAFT_1810198 [Lactarius quietus]|nr:hypothetical protein EI94DRAFT_1810198 [Lactarius quietus]
MVQSKCAGSLYLGDPQPSQLDKCPKTVLLSPESEDNDFGKDAKSSSDSERIYGMERAPEEQGHNEGDHSGVDTLLSPSDQEGYGMDDDDKSLDSQQSFSRSTSSSGQSKCSFGMDSLPLPEVKDNYGMDEPLTPEFHNQGTGPEMWRWDVALKMGAPPLTESGVIDVGPPTNQLPQAVLGRPSGLSIENEDLSHNCSATEVWEWGKHAPSPHYSEMQEGHHRTNTQALQEEAAHIPAPEDESQGGVQEEGSQRAPKPKILECLQLPSYVGKQQDFDAFITNSGQFMSTKLG